MKRYLFPLLAAAPLVALPINNPELPCLFERGVVCSDACDPLFWDLFDVRFDFYGDYIFNTKMEINRVGHADITETRVMTNAAEIDLNWGRFDLFCTLGATKILVQGWDDIFTTTATLANGNPFTLNFDTAFSWSVGGRAALLRWNDFAFGVEGQYFRTAPNLDYAGIYAAVYPGGTGRYTAWQVGGAISYDLAVTSTINLIPYIGASWLDSTLSVPSFSYTDPYLNVGLASVDLQKVQQYMWAFGVTLSMWDCSTLTGEVRFVGENAAFVNYQVQF